MMRRGGIPINVKTEPLVLKCRSNQEHLQVEVELLVLALKEQASFVHLEFHIGSRVSDPHSQRSLVRDSGEREPAVAVLVLTPKPLLYRGLDLFDCLRSR